MNTIVMLNIPQFSLIYLLLLIVLFIMKKSNINQSKLLIIASIRMTVQLILAGLVLTFIFKGTDILLNSIYTLVYIFLMIGFSIFRVFKVQPNINKNLKIIIAMCLSISGLFILSFFICIVIGKNVLEPQYAIPIGGMIIGNSMTGVSLALKTFSSNLKSQSGKIESLQNLGVSPKKILKPLVNQSLETALLPTMNSMLGMGIVSLPGMMTGQILSGTLPMTAIMYQIAIMIAICTSVCLSVFCALHFGYKTLYNKRNQILFNKI